MLGVEEAPRTGARGQHQRILLGQVGTGNGALRRLFVVGQGRKPEVQHFGAVEVVAAR